MLTHELVEKANFLVEYELMLADLKKGREIVIKGKSKHSLDHLR